MNETRLVENALQRFKKLPHSWFQKIAHRNVSGIPDVLGCVRGRFVAVEFKMPRGRATKLQLYTLDCIADAEGGTAICTPDNLEDIVNALQQLSQCSYGGLPGPLQAGHRFNIGGSGGRGVDSK